MISSNVLYVRRQHFVGDQSIDVEQPSAGWLRDTSRSSRGGTRARRRHAVGPLARADVATLGDLLQRDLAELGVPYEPEAGQCDVYRGPWVLYRDAAALFWRPYLFGTVSRDSALANIVVAVSAAKPAS